MKTLIHARYDGKVLIPEEPLELQEGERVTLQIVSPAPERHGRSLRERRLQALEKLAATAVEGANIPDEALRRQNLYEE